mmetsp:Transcript_74386/g.174596  ORF Transcript_74386/g.174596 Transcript_74386/m.174596 type:complete len:260 (-) Transcript_74386:44-823(-)
MCTSAGTLGSHMNCTRVDLPEPVHAFHETVGTSHVSLQLVIGRTNNVEVKIVLVHDFVNHNPPMRSIALVVQRSFGHPTQQSINVAHHLRQVRCRGRLDERVMKLVAVRNVAMVGVNQRHVLCSSASMMRLLVDRFWDGSRSAFNSRRTRRTCLSRRPGRTFATCGASRSRRSSWSRRTSRSWRASDGFSRKEVVHIRTQVRHIPGKFPVDVGLSALCCNEATLNLCRVPFLVNISGSVQCVGVRCHAKNILWCVLGDN